MGSCPDTDIDPVEVPFCFIEQLRICAFYCFTDDSGYH